MALPALVPWIAVLLDIANSMLRLTAIYEDVKSIPQQLVEVYRYCQELAYCVLTLQRICLPDRLQTLDIDDVPRVKSIYERCNLEINDATSTILFCIDACPKEPPSFWDTLSGILVEPEWIQKRDKVGNLLRNVKGSIEILSNIIGANTLEKVCELQLQVGNLQRTIAMGLENLNSNASRQRSTPAGSDLRIFENDRKKKRRHSTSRSVSRQQDGALVDLHVRFRALVAQRVDYLWYGIPSSFEIASQFRHHTDSKAIVISRSNIEPNTLVIMILDTCSWRTVMLRARRGLPYTTVPSRYDPRAVNIVVENMGISTPGLPLLEASPASNLASTAASDPPAQLRLFFESAQDIRELRSILEGFQMKHSSPCVALQWEGKWQTINHSPAEVRALGSGAEFVTIVDIVDVDVGSGPSRVLVFWPFGGFNTTAWHVKESVRYMHLVSPNQKYEIQGRTVYLDNIRMTATRKGIDCIRDLDADATVSGDFKITFRRSNDARKTFDLLISALE